MGSVPRQEPKAETAEELPGDNIAKATTAKHTDVRATQAGEGNRYRRQKQQQRTRGDACRKDHQNSIVETTKAICSTSNAKEALSNALRKGFISAPQASLVLLFLAS
jgi:ABC-type nickel/cobalt efflux system permease component RcnA